VISTLFSPIVRAVVLSSLLLAAVSGYAAPPDQTVNSKTIRVVMDDNYPPFVFKGDQGELKGIVVDQWRLWEKKTGRSVELTGMDWSEAQRRMQAGEFDVIDTIFRNEKREAIYDFTTPYAQLDVPLFFHEDISGIRGPEDLKGFLVAVKAGDSAIDVLKKHGVTNIAEYPSYEKLIEAARYGKAMVFTVDRPPALYYLNKMGIQNRFRETRPLYYGEFHRAVLKGKAKLLSDIEGGFASISKKDYEVIDQRWMGAHIANIPYLSYTLYGTGFIAILLLLLAIWLRVLRRAVAEKTGELAKSEELFSLFMKYSPVYVYIKEVTPAGIRVLQASDNFVDMVGIAGSKMIGKCMEELFPPEFAAKISAADRAVVAKGEVYEIDEDLNGRSYTTIKFPLEQGSRTLLAGFTIDITDRKKAEAELQVAATAFESQAGMVVTDADGTILRVNRAYSEICGYSEDEVIGKNPRIFKSGLHNADFYQSMWKIIKRDGKWLGEIWDRRKNGEEYPKWLAISAVINNDGTITNYIGTHYDITELKQAEEKINKLAYFDQLTGLPNRTLLFDRLKQAMTASARNGNYGALLFIDLDNFKSLNDTHGHDIGDILLQQVAQRLITCVRAEDTVARLGGDEFVVMMVGLKVDEKTAATQTEILGEKILDVLNQPYQLKDAIHHSTPSIGVNLFRGHKTELDTLIKQADIAMYRSKEAGRNTIRFFDPEMETAVMERSSLEKDLREAIQKRQFVLHYQPQMAGGRLIGSEALVRWQHPKRGMVSPANFIPLAEETRLILALGQWVLKTACEQLALWAGKPEMSHLTVAVNVSAHQFHDAGFVDQVLAVLNKTGANPCKLKLELTESMLVTKVDEVIEKMSDLKAKGVGFSLDDFGTGYSSLSYLKRLPLDQLKIDQSFVRDILIHPNDAAIAKTVIALAQSLGFGVIAEGVETAEQLDFLASNGCYAYQGYFFSRPLPIESFDAYAKKYDLDKIGVTTENGI